MFDPLEALVNHTLFKLYYPIHELFPTNLSFQEPVNFGTPYLPLPFLNPTAYLPSNLRSTNWISSTYLINFPFSFFLCQDFVIGSISLSLTLHTKKKQKNHHYLLHHHHHHHHHQHQYFRRRLNTSINLVGEKAN